MPEEELAFVTEAGSVIMSVHASPKVTPHRPSWRRATMSGALSGLQLNIIVNTSRDHLLI